MEAKRKDVKRGDGVRGYGHIFIDHGEVAQRLHHIAKVMYVLQIFRIPLV